MLLFLFSYGSSSYFHFIYTNANIDLEQSHEVSQKEEQFRISLLYV